MRPFNSASWCLIGVVGERASVLEDEAQSGGVRGGRSVSATRVRLLLLLATSLVEKICFDTFGEKFASDRLV